MRASIGMVSWTEGRRAVAGGAGRMTEERATTLAERAVELAGGALQIYRNPRHPFSLRPTQTYDLDGEAVEVRWGEISSPAIVSVAGYVFEILETGIEPLIRPPKPRAED
jgi:hypothetical protein